jgi:hypothetical protein
MSALASTVCRETSAPEVVYGPKDLRITIWRGTREEISNSAPDLPEGWIRLGMRILPDGEERVIAAFVDGKISSTRFSDCQFNVQYSQH